MFPDMDFSYETLDHEESGGEDMKKAFHCRFSFLLVAVNLFVQFLCSLSTEHHH